MLVPRPRSAQNHLSLEGSTTDLSKELTLGFVVVRATNMLDYPFIMEKKKSKY